MTNYQLLTYNFLKILQANRLQIFDIKATENLETRDDIFDRAFLMALRKLNRSYGPIMDDWLWGTINKGHYNIPAGGTDFIDMMLYDIEDKAFSGGMSTIAAGGTSSDFSGKVNSSISFYTSDSETKLYMNFAYSINPHSEFSYSILREPEFVEFNKYTGLYFTRFMPQ